MPFGFPAFTIRTRCDSMYGTTPACFMRSGVTKMPLITASQRFALSAGISPGKAVFTGFATPPHVAASFTAMSTSKPMIAPLEDASSIGGDGGAAWWDRGGGAGGRPSREHPGEGAE